MGLMMGASMLSGSLEQAGYKKSAGAAQGASTGAAMGMMLGPWGAAAGALIGGFVGLTNAANDARKEVSALATAAHREAENKRTAQAVTSFKELISKHNLRNTLANYQGGADQWQKDMLKKKRTLGVDQGRSELWAAGVDEESKVGHHVMASIKGAGSSFRTANKGVGALFSNWADMDSSTEVKKALTHFGINMESDEVDFEGVRMTNAGGTAHTDGAHEYSPLAFAAALLDDEATRLTKGGVWKHVSKVKAGSRSKHDPIANFIRQRQWLKNNQGEWNMEDARGYINLNRNKGKTVDLLGGTETEYRAGTHGDHRYKDIDKYYQTVLRNQLLDDLQGGGGGGFTARALEILEDAHSRKMMGKSYNDLFASEIKDGTINKLSDETTDGEIMSNIAYKMGMLDVVEPKDRKKDWLEQMSAAEIVGEHQLDLMAKSLGSSKISVQYGEDKLKLDGKGLMLLKERAKKDKRLNELIKGTMNAGADKWDESKKQLVMMKRQTTMMEIQLSYERRIIDAKHEMIMSMQKYTHSMDFAAAQNDGLIGQSAKASGQYVKKVREAENTYAMSKMSNNQKMRGELAKLIMSGEADQRGDLKQQLGLTVLDASGNPKRNWTKVQNPFGGSVINFGNEQYQQKIDGKNVDTGIDFVINEMLSKKTTPQLLDLAKNLTIDKDPDAFNAKIREQLKIKDNLDAKARSAYLTVMDQADKELRINEIIKGRVDLMEKLKRKNEVWKLANQEQLMFDNAQILKEVSNIKLGLAMKMGGNMHDRFGAGQRTRELEHNQRLREQQEQFYAAQVDYMLSVKELKAMYTDNGIAGFDSDQFNNQVTNKDRYNYLRGISSEFEGMIRLGSGADGIAISKTIEQYEAAIHDYEKILKAGVTGDDLYGRSSGAAAANKLHGAFLLGKGHKNPISEAVKQAEKDPHWVENIQQNRKGLFTQEQNNLIMKYWEQQKKVLENEKKSLGNMDAMQEALYDVNKTLTFRDQIQRQTLEKMEAEYAVAKKLSELEHKNKIGPGSFDRGMVKGLNSMSDRIDTFYFTLGEDLPQQFSNGMSNALMKAVREGGKLKDVLLDAANSFLDAFNSRMMSYFMDQVTYNLFGKMGGGAGSPPTLTAKNKGGIIRRNKGGKIPTLLTNGEYVMGRDAVSRIGEGGMDALNSGTTPKKFAGGMMLAMNIGSALLQNHLSKKDEKPKHEPRPDDRFQTDGAWKNYNMSTHYMHNNSRVKSYVDKGRQKEGEETQRFIKKWNRRQQLGRSLVTAVGSYGLGKLGQHIESKGGFAKADTWMADKIRGKELNSKVALDGNYSVDPNNPFAGWSGDLDHAPASGNYAPNLTPAQRGRIKIAGFFDGTGSAGIGTPHPAYKDKGNVYSMLPDLSVPLKGQSLPTSVPHSWRRAVGNVTFGELEPLTDSWGRDKYIKGPYGKYIENPDFGKRPAHGLGRPQPINRNQGGHISGPAGIDKVPAMLTEGEYVINANAARKIGVPTLNRINAGKFNSGGLVGEKTGDVGGLGDNTNNINITVNVADGGKSTSETSAAGGGGDTAKIMDQFSQKIKQQVIMVVKEESRPGGLLG